MKTKVISRFDFQKEIVILAMILGTEFSTFA